jgi:hypothetical protein
MYKFRRKKTPMIMGNEYGNGTTREIPILIAKDIPNHRA